MTLYFIGFLALRLLCLTFVVVLILRIAAGTGRHRGDGALAALERRFVAGELPEEDFRHMRDVLES
ncbi:MAG: hypothetical protein NT080_00245 [Spirochaetes bacterium]|nr:hypothetical protein [Spirochaetota bacterium]